MSMLPWPLFLALSTFLSVLCTNAVDVPKSALSFRVSSGGNDNYFLRDDITSAQLLITNTNNTTPVRRLVFALPAGNSGGLVYFLPLSGNVTTANGTQNVSSAENSMLGISVVNGTFRSTTDEFNNTGAEVELAFTGNATLGVTIIGAVRAMRGTFETLNHRSCS